jgi:hypothetical protein
VAWELQGNRRYYYRSRREGRRVRREFLGRGPEAELAAALTEFRRRQRQAQRDARRADRERWVAASAPLGRLIALTELLTEAALAAAGYHGHKGEWRKRRVA